jgi:hypothetical protein
MQHRPWILGYDYPPNFPIPRPPALFCGTKLLLSPARNAKASPAGVTKDAGAITMHAVDNLLTWVQASLCGNIIRAAVRHCSHNLAFFGTATL